jgi:hypothetical protein
MPFVLRRTKQQVLSDLPPKIITDIVCELSPLQRQLYEDFAASAALSEVAGALAASAAAAAAGGGEEAGGAQGGKGSGHIFTALLYLRRLCSHPLLALDWQVGVAGAGVNGVLERGRCVGVWACGRVRGVNHQSALPIDACKECLDARMSWEMSCAGMHQLHQPHVMAGCMQLLSRRCCCGFVCMVH